MIVMQVAGGPGLVLISPAPPTQEGAPS